jgi:hypothetical protein
LEGCLFHFCQALWRQLQEWGLTVVYRNDGSGVRWFVKKITALAFLPHDRIQAVFDYLVQHRWPVGVDPQDPSLRGWLRYVHTAWICNNSAPRAFWSVYMRPDNRTNNFLESKHNVFRDIFLPHSPLWTFLARLITHHNSELTTQHVHSFGQSPSSRSIAQVDREKNLSDIKQLYTAGQLNNYEYIRRVAHFLKDY